MLYLDAADVMELTDPDAIMDVIEQAYAIDLSGKYDMPSRIHIDSGSNTILYMPCFLKNIFGTKILTLFPGNITKDMAVINGIVLLNDAETGTPLAILDGARVTAVRTGAVGGVAVRHTSPVQAKSIGLIGAGVQGYYQVVFACTARHIENVLVYDISKEKLPAFCDQLRLILPNTSIKPVQSVQELLKGSEIVITATPSREPVLPDNEDLLRGKCFLGIGSYKPDMREFPKALFNLVEKVLIDTEHGLEESGDLITPLKEKWLEKNQIVKIGRFIAADKNRDDREETTLFKSVGMALFDIVVSEHIYQKALKKGIGKLF